MRQQQILLLSFPIVRPQYAYVLTNQLLLYNLGQAGCVLTAKYHWLILHTISEKTVFNIVHLIEPPLVILYVYIVGKVGNCCSCLLKHA